LLFTLIHAIIEGERWLILARHNIGRKDNKQVNTRLSDLEYLEIKKNADDNKLSISRYLKKEILGFLDKNKRKSKENEIYVKISKDDIILLANEMRKIGTNINQIAKCLNYLDSSDVISSNNINDDYIKDVSKVIKDTREIMIKIWKLLS
jgi:hypothetical protein